MLKVMSEMNDKLTRPLIFFKIFQTITSLPWGKTSGWDGIPTNFLKTRIKTTSPHQSEWQMHNNVDSQIWQLNSIDN
jgi:hypothetical protein